MKSILISGIVGVAFMVGGFVVGMKLTPAPPKPAPVAVVETKPVDPTLPPKDPISVDDLRKTSESMMSLNEALKLRESQIAEKELKLRQKEDELHAERVTLDSTHEKFKSLFGEFQDRLQLVEANQLEQVKKQASLYGTMNAEQSVDLIRSMEDPAITRLFSVMDTKPLSKMVAQWKTKYPAEAPRLMHVLDDMAKVLPKDKIALSDPAASAAALAPLNANPAPDATPAPTEAPATPAPEAPAAPAPVTTPSPAPSPAAPETPASAAPTLAPPPEAPAPAAPTAAPTTSLSPDITTPGATAATPIPDPDNALPANPTPAAHASNDSPPDEHHSPRALPVTINTAASN